MNSKETKGQRVTIILQYLAKVLADLQLQPLISLIRILYDWPTKIETTFCKYKNAKRAKKNPETAQLT